MLIAQICGVFSEKDVKADNLEVFEEKPNIRTQKPDSRTTEPNDL